MVVAGPGSGKTRVLTFRIAHLISIGVPAYQILALTFTNKAAAEMKERIVALVGAKSSQLWMGTFHSIFARILRTECEAIGFQRNFTIYDSQDSLALIKSVMEFQGISWQRFNPQAVRSRISGSKNQLITPEEAARRAVDIFEEKSAQVFVEYQRRLKQYNAMDFDDLLLKPIELFNGHKQVLAKYQDRFRFILIDEYQDTNRAQYTLIRLLADRHKNICVVGDDAQSIYAFRGADIRNILDFERDYPEARTIRLEQNYRSTKAILGAADTLIKHNVEQIPKDLWTENGDGDPISVVACDDDKDEGMTIVSRIYEESRRLKLDLKDVAIMYRTNAQSRSLEDALRRQNIPYSIVGGVEFYQRKEVKDAMAYLRALVNPRDQESVLRIINFPARGLGDVALQRLVEFAEAAGADLPAAAARASEIPALTPKARGGFLAFGALLAKYRALAAEMSLSELSRAYIDEIGLLKLFKEEGTPEAMARWDNVQELLSAISEFSAQRPDATLELFLQDVSLVSNMDEWNDSHNAVTLMTLHAAKGLEFPLVFVAGLEEGLLPFYSSSIERKELEEERRLLYVGMTRAMRKLTLTHARVRFRFGEMSYQSPSRFLEEMGGDLTQTESAHRGTPYRSGASPSAAGREFPRPKKKTADSESHYFRDEQPDYDVEGVSAAALKAGVMVEHEMFGRGKIVHVAGAGEALKAVVDFPAAGRKNLLLKYARLKIV
jgi:DNA helicase-2/ATP-dependent DNA helicase PcrA